MTRTVTVRLNYAISSFLPVTTGYSSPLALPLEVMDADGSLVEEKVVSTDVPAQFDVSHVDGPVFVRLTWPSGKTMTRRVDVAEGNVEVLFDDSSISRNEWSAWAVPRLNPHTSLASPQAGSDVRIKKFDRVWLRMWTFENSQWVPSRIDVKNRYHNDVARQVDFELDEKCRVLQLGGMNVPWRFVALPGGGACRVLLTPNQSHDPRADPLKIIVTSFRRDAENLLEFLARDSLRAAHALASAQPLARQLLSDKGEDPISAVAAAYFLLRTEGWRRIPAYWFANLFHMYPWLADPAVIQSMLKIRAGLQSKQDEQTAASLLEISLSRGVPLFSEGLSLLKEAASVLRIQGDSGRQSVFERVERLYASQAWAGAALSFYGALPDQPSPLRLTGLPGKPMPVLRNKARANPRPPALLQPRKHEVTFLSDL